ncbi:MAG: hydrogenase 4 subunit B [Bryobacteraceae bacterium]
MDSAVLVPAAFSVALLCFAAGWLLSLAIHARRGSSLPLAAVIHGFALAGSISAAMAGAGALAAGGPWRYGGPDTVAGFSFSVRLDPLSAFFLLALSALAVPVSVYSFGYVRHGGYGGSPVLRSGLFNALLAAMTLIFTAGNVVLFLVAWEAGVVASYFLITASHEEEETRHGGWLFILMSRAGAGMIYIGLLLLAGSAGSLNFDRLTGAGNTLPAAASTAAFLLLFFGFGVKAGIIPLHAWLPAAHPVAPSNVSSLLSGIVIKTGIYGIARVCFDFYGGLPPWAGMVVLGAGVVSGLLGVLYALMEHDLKRLLAFHSIENIGIILMGFGGGMLLRTYGYPKLAALALVAGLFHTLNHALFKGLLFLGAGAVVHASHTRNMEEMGGLIRRMPRTALYFLIGAVAISGLPPLNGFVSEWLTYQALLAGFGTTTEITRVAFPVAGALLALTAALAAACFVKAFGITFLALPRSEHARRAGECGPSMRAGMAWLAAACVVLGLGAPWFLPAFDGVTLQLLKTRISLSAVSWSPAALQAPPPRTGAVSPLALGLLLVAFSLGPWMVWLLRRHHVTVRTGAVWDCGLPALKPSNEYTATGFSKSIRMIFSAVFRPRREIQPLFEASPYFPTEIRFESDIRPVPGASLHSRLQDSILRFALRVRQIQAGSLHAYLAYIFVALILLLLFGVRT